MSGVMGMGMLLAGPSWAQPPDPPPESTEIQAEDLRALRTEMRAFQETLEAQRLENARLREELERTHRAPSSVPASDEERVGFGQRVLVERGQEVSDVVAFGNDVVVDGVVRGDATAFGGSVLVTANGVVRGNAIAFGGEVTVEDGGQVLGDRVALEDPTGTTSVHSSVPVSGFQSLLSSLYHRLVLLLSFAGAGVLVIGLFPNRVDRIAQGLGDRPLWSAVLGTTATVLLTVFSVLFTLLTLGLGSPVSALLFAWLGAAWLFGFVGLCQAVGDRLPFADKPHGRWLTFLVGTILLSCLGSLPWVGWLVVFAASMLGVGAAITSRFGGR